MYYLLCMKQGALLPGAEDHSGADSRKSQPSMRPFESPTKNWNEGQLDVSQFADYLEALLEAQLSESP